jgi:aminopeptidase YwaD
MRYIFIIFLLSCTYKPENADLSRIKEHITKLASDDFQGRELGSEGERKAADLIIKQFQAAGLKPLKENFEVPFKYNGEVELLESTFQLSKFELILNKDFQVLPYSANIKSEKLTARFLNYGIISEKEKYNDYKNLDVKGKIVFVLEGYPESADAHSGIAYKSNLREKVRMARDKGAVALVQITNAISPLFSPKHISTDAGIAVLQISNSMFINMFKQRPNQMKRGRGLSKKVSINVNIKRIEKEPINIVAYKEGVIKDKYIVLGAHYDHLGLGYQSGAYNKNTGQIHNGADDNASGTAALIEIAHLLKDYQNHYSILFMAFSGEELGLLGSKALFKDKVLNPNDIRMMINMDMIGRLNSENREMTVYAAKTAIEFDTIVTHVNKPYAFNLKPVDHSPGNSDHAAFYQEKIPVLFFNTELHNDYHKPSDDADKINIEGLADISNFIRDLITKVDLPDQKITYNYVKEPNKGAVRQFSVYIGTLPNYGYQGKGFKIDGASTNSPAEKAGMMKGDIIVSLDKQKIENIYDYMGVLGSLKAGKEVPVIVKRDEKLVTLVLIPGSKN